jgi:hypothetical protein
MVRIKGNVMGRNTKNFFKAKQQQQKKQDEKGQLIASFSVALSFKILKDTHYLLLLPFLGLAPVLLITTHSFISMINSAIALLPAPS